MTEQTTEDGPQPVKLRYKGNSREFQVMGEAIAAWLRDCRLSNRNKVDNYPQAMIWPIPAVYPADHMKRFAKLFPLRWDCSINEDNILHVITEDGDGVGSTFTLKPVTHNPQKVVAIWKTDPDFFQPPTAPATVAPAPEILPAAESETAVTPIEPQTLTSTPKKRKKRTSKKITPPPPPPTHWERFRGWITAVIAPNRTTGHRKPI